MSALMEMMDALESVCDFEDLDCVEAVSYRQGALRGLLEVAEAGGVVPEAVQTRWLAICQQAVDTYQAVPRWAEIKGTA